MNNQYKANIIKIIDEIKKTNKIPRNTKLTIDILLYKDTTDKTLLEYMLENKIVCYYSFIPEMPKSKEAVLLMHKYGRINELFNIDTKIYLCKIDNEKTLLEDLIEKKEIDSMHNLKFEYDEKLLQILKNTNRLDLISKILITENQLFQKIDEEHSLIEKLIKNDIIDYIKMPKIQYHTEILEILQKYNRLDIIEKILFNENILLNNGENCLLKRILDTGYIPNLQYCKTKTLDYLYKINRPELMTKMFLEKENIDFLFYYLSLNDNVISYLLKEEKKGIKINIRDLTTHIYQLSESELIDIYLKFAKYDKLDYLTEISKEELLKRNRKKECMLDKFVKLDIENTKKIIEYYGLSNDIDIMIYFKFKKINYDIKGLNFELLDKDIYSYEFILEENENLKNTINYNNISDNIKELLLELQDLMNDNQSNKDMVEAMLLSYAKEISKGNENAIIELEKLIEIKRNNPNFKIFRSDNGSYFNENDGIGLMSCDINTLNHELGHLFHYYLAQDSIPNELENELQILVNNEKLKNNTQILSVRLNNYEDKLLKEIEIEYDEWAKEYFSEDKIIEIKEFIEMSKEEKIEQYIKLGYKKEDLNIILSDTYTYEQYMQCQKRIKCNEMFNNLMSTILPELRAISDIVDAVYAGEYHNSRLTTLSGEEIEGTFGHGISYYSSINSIFQEMIANYSLILKSDNKERALAMLKELVGENLLNILDNFYKEKIINSPSYTLVKNI